MNRWIALCGVVATCFAMAGAQASDFREHRMSGHIIWFHSSHELREGTGLIDEGKYAQGIEVIEKQLERGLHINEMAYAMNSLCVAYLGLGQLQKALENCDVALRHDSTLWQASNNRGNVHFYLKAYDKALTDYQTAHGLDPDEVGLAQVESNIALVQRLITSLKTN